MSSRLKKRPNNIGGFSKTEQRAFDNHNKVQNQVDIQAKNIGRTFSYITYEILYDKFDFSMKRMINFYAKWDKAIKNWKANESGWTSKELLEWAEKKELFPYQFVKSIPMSSKLKLAQKNSGKHIMGIESTIESHFLIALLTVEKVLIEDYRFTRKQISGYCYWLDYFVDSYARNYLTDEMVIQLFLEEENYDIHKGEKVA